MQEVSGNYLCNVAEPLLKTKIAYIRERPGLSVADQRELAQEAGCTLVYEHGEHKGRDMRAEWVKALGVGRDVVAWVARLDVLLRPKDECGATPPSRDLAMILSAVAAKAHAVVEGATGATSDLSQQWQDRVSWAMHRATGGTSRDIEAQRRHGKRGGALTRSRSIGGKWKSPRYKDKLREAAVAWRDPECQNWEDAVRRLPEELRTLSYVSLWRLLGPRKPNGPSNAKGGRPTKSAKRRVRYVYFIQRGSKREVKIGSAYGVRSRFGSLKTASPDDLRLIGVLAGDDKTEREMHKRFKAHWIRREWFRLEGELAAFIKQLPKVETP